MHVLGWLLQVVDFVKQIKALFADGLPWRKREPAEPGPPSPTIPDPGGRFEFTRATTIEADELKDIGGAVGRGSKLQPAADLDELMVGDMLTFRVAVLDGREPLTDWGVGRAICPRADSILTKVLRTPRFGHLHGIEPGSVIEVPREALAHVFRITASGAGL
jgi:hypothetical protein